jgi:uncharacterized protein (TIGR01777 family)
MSKVVITGASGLVGRKLKTHLAAQGQEVIPMARGAGPASESSLRWDPERGEIDAVGLEGCDSVVHLAGENIAGRRWSAAQKERIQESRVRGTTLLCETLAKLEFKPQTLVSASAVGYYGDRGDYACDESAACGTGFLPDVCVAWEAATEPALRAGIRVVNLRIGMVLSRDGGALAKMLLPFQFGLGGVIGNGKQYMSWITLHDLIMAIDHCLNFEGLRGPVNAVAPNAVTNYEFTKTLGRVIRRPTIFPMPAFAARLAFGEIADALLLASTRVVPKHLAMSGFHFESPDLESGLRKVLGKSS